MPASTESLPVTVQALSSLSGGGLAWTLSQRGSRVMPAWQPEIRVGVERQRRGALAWTCRERVLDCIHQLRGVERLFQESTRTAAQGLGLGFGAAERSDDDHRHMGQGHLDNVERADPAKRVASADR